MRKIAVQETPAIRDFYYGGVIILMGALIVFFSGPGQTFSVSIFINSYIKQFGWSRSMVSGFYSIATLCAGLTLPFIGKKIDVWGHRKMVTIISTLLGLACLWMSFIIHPVMLFVGFFMIRLLGQGSMTLIYSTLVPQWFVSKRGIALSIASIGGVLGSALLPPLNNWLILNRGASFAWRFWMILLIGVMAPIGWLFVRNKPEDMGLLPDGKKQVTNNKDTVETKEVEEERSWTLKEAMKTRAFWLMLFCMTIPAMINTGFTFHMVSIIEGKGFTSTFAATILSITAMVQFPTTFLAGYVVDRVKVHYVKSLCFVVLITTMLIMLNSNSRNILLVYGVIHGIYVAFDSVSTGVLWPNYFGRKHLGSIRGVTMTAMVIGSAFGPLPFGIAYDRFNGYREIILIMMIVPVLGSIAAYFSPSPNKTIEELETTTN